MITEREKRLLLWLPPIGSLYETVKEEDKIFYWETKPFNGQETLKTVFKVCYTDTNTPKRTFLPPGKRFYLNNIEICQNIVAILEICLKCQRSEKNINLVGFLLLSLLRVEKQKKKNGFGNLSLKN